MLLADCRKDRYKDANDTDIYLLFKCLFLFAAFMLFFAISFKFQADSCAVFNIVYEFAVN